MMTPILIYLDATTLIDYCWDAEPRHTRAEDLVKLCSTYIGDIELCSSSWSWTETHGRIYDKLLERDEGISFEPEIRGHKAAYKRPRTYFPPIRRKLEEAAVIITQRLKQVEEQCSFRWISPGKSEEVLRLTKELAKKTAIYPQDSLHLALAIDQLVHFFVATDGDLLDRIFLKDHRDFIEQLRADISHPNTPPPFEAVPLEQIRYTQRTTPARTDILTRLRELGFS